MISCEVRRPLVDGFLDLLFALFDGHLVQLLQREPLLRGLPQHVAEEVLLAFARCLGERLRHVAELLLKVLVDLVVGVRVAVGLDLEVVHDDGLGLPVAVDAPDPLLEHVRVPREIVVHDRVAPPLHVEPLAARRRRDDEARLVLRS